MDYKKHKEYFTTAYNTGSDAWTNIVLDDKAKMFTEKLNKDAMILDLGSGRGMFSKNLAENGFRVIGIDFAKDIVNKLNKEIKAWGLSGKLKFMDGDALDIPFADNSFDAVCDIGLLQNLYKNNWQKYAEEIFRVLKPGGIYFNTSLSRETPKFFEFNPKASVDGEFEKYNLHYHFFTKEELENLFENKLQLERDEIKIAKKPYEMHFIETLFIKNS